MISAWYRAGKITAPSGQNVITGTGTQWANNVMGVAIGQALYVTRADGNTLVYEILAVDSDTRIRINGNIVDTLTDSNYAIHTTVSNSYSALARESSAQLGFYQQLFKDWQNITTGTGDITIIAPDGTKVVIPSLTKISQDISNKVSQQQLTDGLANKLTILTTYLSTDLNTAVTSGVYHPTAVALNLPIETLGIMEVLARIGGTQIVQTFHATILTVINANRHFVRVGTLTSGVWTFTQWAEQHSSLTLAAFGIGQLNQPDIANFDFQNFEFKSGANYVTSYNTWVNPPAGVTYNAGTRVSIRVIYVSSVNGSRIGLELTPDTGAAANFKVCKLLSVGAAGSRVFTFNQDWNSAIAIPISGGGTGSNTLAGAKSELGITALESDAFTATKIENTPWINLTLQNGWISYPEYRYAYRKVLGMIFIEATIRDGTSADGTIIATLPLGYRPLKNMVMPATGAHASPNITPRVVVAPSGAITTAGFAANNTITILGCFSLQA
ncbi:TPA: hypothetical protein RPG34_000015 [Yersinia enterocolitica]|nr:hypothetical protein [Yersinia enterocolitica]